MAHCVVVSYKLIIFVESHMDCVIFYTRSVYYFNYFIVTVFLSTHFLCETMCIECYFMLVFFL